MGTSLAPYNFEKQMRAVKSWIDNNFEVVSFNCLEEIEILRPYFEAIGVEFVKIERDASEKARKKLPYLQDILDGVSKRTKQICGFFNSDIYVKNISAKMYGFIYDESKHSVVYTRRNEISEYEDINKMEWTIHFDGLDLFFIDKYLVPDFFDDGFYVQTTWSACFLEKCRIKNIPVKELVNPIAFHQRHSIKWNFEENNRLVESFWRQYYGTVKGAFENALCRYYCDILEFVQKICYCSVLKDKCLFKLVEENEETIRSIKNQEDIQVTIENDDINRGEFDYIIYVSPNVILEKVFCKLAISLMEEYDLSELNLGRFFVSEIEENVGYNSLNRNLNVVKEINEVSQVYTTICRNNFSTEKNGKVFLPVLYEKINIDSEGIIENKRVSGEVYLMPSGVRANEWYEINRHRLKHINIKGFLDNNKEKVGKLAAGKVIYFADEVLKTDKNAWIILASKYYNQEIKEQLLELVDENKIIDAGYIMRIDEGGDFYCFNLEKYKQYFGQRR